MPTFLCLFIFLTKVQKPLRLLALLKKKLQKDHANRMWEAYYTKAAAPEATAALSEYNNIQDAVQASMRTAYRAADDLNDPREIQRIVAEQDKAREAEQKLNQALQ